RARGARRSRSHGLQCRAGRRNPGDRGAEHRPLGGESSDLCGTGRGRSRATARYGPGSRLVLALSYDEPTSRRDPRLMTSPGFLDFFVLEASEYIEQIDGLMSKGGGGGPEPEALVRYARALRGSATMARLTPFADLASALERVGRGLREGTVAWSPAL